MSEQTPRDSTAAEDAVASLATRIALETPGVLRLEPTLRGFLSRFGHPAPPRTGSGQPEQDHAPHVEGASATVRDGAAHIRLEVATDLARPALDVAEDLRRRIRESAVHAGVAPVTVDVAVLAIEAPPPGPR